jgi:acyl-CoA thioester hydrolase
MDPPAGAFEGREHRLGVRVYYEDTDFTGFVYHANYLRFFERGRSDFLRLAGADHVAMAALNTAFVVLRVAIDFRRAARIDDALTVVTAVGSARAPRIRFVQRIERGAEIVCQAEVDAACIDAAGRARRPPRELVAALSPYLPS